MATLTDLLTSKIPPHSLEAERAVLGAILLERESLPKAIELLKPADFYKEGHRKIFDATLALFERNEPVDLLTVSEELKRRAELEEVGGAAALASLVEEATTAAHLLSYGAIVRREGAPARPHPHRHRHHRAELRGPGRRGQAARRRGAADLPGLRAADAGRGLPGAGHPQGHLRAHREALRPQGAHHRARHRLRRSRPDDVGLPAERLHHHRGAALDGQDRLRAERGQVRRRGGPQAGAGAEPRDVQGAARAAAALLRGQGGLPQGAHRLPRPARLDPPDQRGGPAGGGPDLHRRLARAHACWRRGPRPGA